MTKIGERDLHSTSPYVCNRQWLILPIAIGVIVALAGILSLAKVNILNLKELHKEVAVMMIGGGSLMILVSLYLISRVTPPVLLFEKKKIPSRNVWKEDPNLEANET